MFGIINVLLFFPSGALYPIESYPPWLARLSAADPLTYGLRALRSLLLRGSAPQAVVRRLDLPRDVHARCGSADEGAVPAGGLGDGVMDPRA